MNDEDLKQLIRGEESRIADYKLLLSWLFKEKIEDDWLKNTCREMKTLEEASLSKHRQEITNVRQGLNPSFYYN